MGYGSFASRKIGHFPEKMCRTSNGAFYAPSCSSNVLASLRSAVSKPSVNQL